MPLTTETAEALRRYRHAANYLAAAQLYLRANCLLEEPLGPSTSRRGCLATAELPHRLAQRADLQHAGRGAGGYRPRLAMADRPARHRPGP